MNKVKLAKKAPTRPVKSPVKKAEPPAIKLAKKAPTRPVRSPVKK